MDKPNRVLTENESLVNIFIKLKERNQYDEFLHKIQQEKMKELWDNTKDKDWEDV